MTARVILVPKVNSHPFDDRVLLLDVPCKIGRAHKDDQVSVLLLTYLKKSSKIYDPLTICLRSTPTNVC